MIGVIEVKKESRDMRYSRKIGRMGNSLGVSLPKALAEQLNLGQGDEIEFVTNANGEVTIKKVRQMKLPDNVRPEVLEAFFDVFEEDKGILRDLKDTNG